MADAHADVSKHVKAYLAVFAALAVLTVVTVAVSLIHFPGKGNIIVALLIATVKASLVAAIFMHLKWEKAPSIWWALAICVVFFAVLMWLPSLTTNDLPPQVQHTMWDVQATSPPAQTSH
jgi:cytochrome c oxidase subunit 4